MGREGRRLVLSSHREGPKLGRRSICGLRRKGIRPTKLDYENEVWGATVRKGFFLCRDDLCFPHSGIG